MSPNIFRTIFGLLKVDVMVTNGGYGAVQRALATGVPLVVAGDTEGQARGGGARRVVGCGHRPENRCPSSCEAVRHAVREVLGDDRDPRRARALEVSYAQRDGIAEIGALIDEVVTERSAAVTSELRRSVLFTAAHSPETLEVRRMS